MTKDYQRNLIDWAEKSDMLRENPVTVVRLFGHRVQIIIRQVILSVAHPIGDRRMFQWEQNM